MNSVNKLQETNNIGSTTAKAFSNRLLSPHLPVRSQRSACGICDKITGTGTDFPRIFWLSPESVILKRLHLYFFDHVGEWDGL
jgi:hypothetical protein